MTPIDILLVEDNEGDILLTTEALLEGKIAKSIFVVKDGQEALNYLLKKGKYNRCTTPDLVLLDINLPKVNGHEVLNQMRAHEKLRDFPVIILSTSPSGEDLYEPYRNLSNCYISKPVDAKDIDKVVQSIKDFWSSNFCFSKSLKK